MKTTMGLLLLIFGNILHAQMLVTDTATNASLAAANSTMATTLTKATAQLSQLEKSYAIMKKASDKIEKVSSVVQSVNDIKELIKLQDEAITNVKLITKHKKSKNTYNILTNLLQNITKHIGNVNKVLTKGFFSMSDKERTDFFKEEKSIIFGLTARTRGMANPYK